MHLLRQLAVVQKVVMSHLLLGLQSWLADIFRTRSRTSHTPMVKIRTAPENEDKQFCVLVNFQFATASQFRFTGEPT